MTTLVQQRQQTTFRLYPTDHLIAIVDSPVRAEAALRELLDAGFPPASIVTWYGPRGAALIDPAGATHGPLARLWRLLQALTEDRPLLERYAAAARVGQVCIGVHVARRSARARADQILTSFGAHDRVFCGSVAVEILPSIAAPGFLYA